MYDLLNFLFWNGVTKGWDVDYPLEEALEAGFIAKWGDYVTLTPEGYKTIYSFKMIPN